MRKPTSPQPLGAAAAALPLILALLVSGCGGGGESFAAQADRICTDQALRVNRVLADGGTPRTATEAAARDSELLPIEREAVTGLGDLDPPQGSGGDTYRGFLAARRLALRLSQGRARAASRRAGAAYAAIGARRQRIVAEADARASRAGLLACAERLSRGAARAVRTAINRIATSPDPSLCSDEFTANFVRSEFGGPGECRRRQRRPGSAARSVGISDLRGIDRVYAVATIVPRGGDSGGQRTQLGMVYEDGAYQADSLTHPSN